LNGIGDSRKLQWLFAGVEANKIEKLAEMYDNDLKLFGYRIGKI